MAFCPSIVCIVLTAVAAAGPSGCSEKQQADPRAAPAEGSADQLQDEKPEENKGWRERLKEKLARSADKADEVARKTEAMLGAEVKPYVVAVNGGAYPDVELRSFLEKIVLGMAAATGEPDIAWDFTIVNSDELNAFALPGGKVFITRGLLAALESEAQFAHVMGHEMGHVVHRHMIRTWGLNGLQKLLLGAAAKLERKILEKRPDETAFVSAALGVGAKFAALKYSRDQELESDACGVDYALAAGYDPREGRRTFEMYLRLKQESGENESLLRNLLSTHPLDSDRIERIDAYIQEKHPEVAEEMRSLVKSSEAWRKHQARLRGAATAYDMQRRAMALLARAVEEGTREGVPEAIDLLDEAIEARPDHAALHFSRGYGHYVGGDNVKAERDLDRAIELDEAHFQARLLRGVIRKQGGRHAEAVEDLEAATGIVPANPVPHYYLGECWEALGKEPAAEESYEQAVRLAPDGSKLKESAEARLSAIRAGD